MSRVHLTIGRLAVHGIELRRPETLGPTLGAALTRLIAERGTPAAWDAGGELALRPLTVTVHDGMAAETFADHLALALYEGLGG
jgi:hypothetical protein